MELLLIEHSRLVELLMATRPAGPLPLPAIIDAIQGIFGFESQTTPHENAREKGLVFANGSYNGVAIDSLAFHDDGLVWDARVDTDVLHEVSNHLKDVAQTKYGYKIIKTRKASVFHKSAIMVHASHDLLSGLEAWAEAKNLLEKAFEKEHGSKALFVASGMAMTVDPLKSVVRPVPFRLERKDGVEFGFNHYFSEAPVSTKAHLAILKAIEKLT